MTREVGEVIEWQDMKVGDVVEFVQYSTPTHRWWSYSERSLYNVVTRDGGYFAPEDDDGCRPPMDFGFIFKLAKGGDVMNTSEMPYKMQVGDWVSASDIPDEETLNKIRAELRSQGNRVSSGYGSWEKVQRLAPARLRLDGDTDLACCGHQRPSEGGLRITPQMLGVTEVFTKDMLTPGKHVVEREDGKLALILEENGEVAMFRENSWCPLDTHTEDMAYNSETCGLSIKAVYEIRGARCLVSMFSKKGLHLIWERPQKPLEVERTVEQIEDELGMKRGTLRVKAN